MEDADNELLGGPALTTDVYQLLYEGLRDGWRPSRIWTPISLRRWRRLSRQAPTNITADDDARPIRRRRL